MSVMMQFSQAQDWISLNGANLSLPGLSIPIQGVGTVGNISLRVNQGSYSPSTSTLYVKSGTLGFSGAPLGISNANVSELIMTAGPNGFIMKGSACVQFLGQQCRSIDTVVPYSGQLTKQLFVSTINGVLGRTIFRRRIGYRQQPRTHNYHFAMKMLRSYR